jgi:hypothetical protein
MIELTIEREIAAYVWVYPDDDRRSERESPINSILGIGHRFTVEMLERLYTLPGRLKANAERRDVRREAAKNNPLG